jgi:predicted amidohydrolase YtcJ
MSVGIDRDWRIETHAIGDRAARTLLDVYERLVVSNTGIPAGHPSH